MKIYRSLLGLCVFSGLISACEMSHGPAVFSNDKHVGVYKVGKPYQIDGTWYTPHVDEAYEEVGMASWYGPGFHKKLTANGDVFDQNALTAAHRTLPLPSMVRVTNLDNGRTLVVMVNDRGPFSKGRILDLSERAADILGSKEKGLARVKVKFLPGQTRRLLSQLEVKDHKANPYATNDADVIGITTQHASANESGSMGDFSSFMDGIDLPLPEYFNISDVNEAKMPALENGSPSSGGNDPVPMQVAQAETAEPIGLEADFFREVNAAAQTPAALSHTEELTVAKQSAATRIAQNAKDESALTPDAAEKKMPETLPEPVSEPINEAETIKPMLVKPESIDTPEMAMKSEDEREVLSEVPEGKVLLDKTDPHYKSEIYYIQAGSFRMEENARRVQKSLAILGEKAEVETIELASGDLSRVRLGPIYNQTRAKQTLQKVVRMGYADAMMVAD